MRIHPVFYGFLVLGVFLGTILAFQSAGVWSVSGKITASGEQVQPDAADVDSIKGWMTLEQISTTYQVPLADLLAQFDLPLDTSASTAIKDLETDTFSVTNLRAWLLERMALLNEDSGSAVKLAIPTPSGSPIAATPDAPIENPAATPPVAAPTADASIDKTVTGKNTFQDLINWGVPKETIEKVLGRTIPDPSMVIKDYLNAQGVEFSSIKAALQTEVDKIK